MPYLYSRIQENVSTKISGRSACATSRRTRDLVRLQKHGLVRTEQRPDKKTWAQHALGPTQPQGPHNVCRTVSPSNNPPGRVESSLNCSSLGAEPTERGENVLTGVNEKVDSAATLECWTMDAGTSLNKTNAALNRRGQRSL